MKKDIKIISMERKENDIQLLKKQVEQNTKMLEVMTKLVDVIKTLDSLHSPLESLINHINLKTERDYQFLLEEASDNVNNIYNFLHNHKKDL